MRSSRLIALLLELGRAPATTVAQLAAAHGVSSRTIERDIAALQTMGVPVWTRTGPGGGVGLVKGWRSPITGMTAPELQALIIGDAGARGLGLEAEFQAARLKMLAATARSGQIEAVKPAEERFLLDHEAWFTDPERPEALPAVAKAVWVGRRLRIRYQRAAGDSASRVVDPLGLVLKGEHWYLVAAHRRSPRTYRVTRIRSVEELSEPAWRPADFSLAQHWRAARTEFEASLQSLPVRVTVPVEAVALLRAATSGAPMRHLPHDTGAGGSADGQRACLQLMLEGPEIAASQLIAVPGVEVLGPEPLRRMVLARAEDLVARHGERASALEGPEDDVEEGEPQDGVEQSDPQ